MPRPVLVLRVDPNRRTVATLRLKSVKDPSGQLRSMIRAKELGSHEILEVDGVPVMSIGRLDVDESMRGWRFPGGVDTAGISVICGRNKETGALIDTPMTAARVLERIQWLEGEDVEGREGRAEETLPLLDDDLRAALVDAVVTPGGEMWLPAKHKDAVGTAMVALGLGTSGTGGQLLTKLGEAVHDKLAGALDAAEVL